MAPIDSRLKRALDSMCSKLARRRGGERKLNRYYDGSPPLPDVIVQAKITKAYNMLMGQATAPWGALVVDAVQERLEITGLNSGEKNVDDALWGLYQENYGDSESRLVHNAALVAGRAFGTVWPNEKGQPEFSFDNASQMIVKYAEGSRRKRVAALRYWVDDDTRRPNCTLYLPDGLYKFRAGIDDTGPDGLTWEQRLVDGEEWPVPNPFGVVPVVEFPVNRRLKAGPWGWARGEFEHVCSTIDRINILTLLGLIVAFWMGFPLRGVVGDRILRDDEGNPLPPFQIGADQVVQFENPDTKFLTFPAADRSNLSIYGELDQMAALTKTPVTYMPHAGSISNISADALRAAEAGLVGKIPPHKSTLGEAWEELLRIGGLMLDRPAVLSQRAELQWTDHENRSLAERADAATKLKDILPWQALAENVLNATAEQMQRWQTMRAGDAMSQLIAAAANPTVPANPTIPAPMPMPVPVPRNGNG